MKTSHKVEIHKRKLLIEKLIENNQLHHRVTSIDSLYNHVNSYDHIKREPTYGGNRGMNKICTIVSDNQSSKSNYRSFE